MKAKIEQTSNDTPSNNYSAHQVLWDFSNFVTVAATTCASIVLVQSPIKSMIVNLTKNGTIMPNYSSGFLAMTKTLYAGTGASLAGSAVRTAYVTGAKSNKPSEPVHEEIGKKTSVSNVGYVMSAAFGDIIVTQIPESLSTLKKAGILPPGFKWRTPYNAFKLMSGGFGARYSAGMVNFGALCLVEEKYAEHLPINDHRTKHFVAGFCSGVTAAGLSYPFAVIKDATLVQSTVNSSGQLVNKSTVKLLKEAGEKFFANPKACGKTLVEGAIKQMPLRMGLTGIIFSIVGGVNATLGKEPLANIVPEEYRPRASSNGFFAAAQQNNPDSPIIEEVVEPSSSIK